MATYGFSNITASFSGATGAIDLGYGASIAKEGISIALAGDRDVMTVGADGSVMHSLKEDKSGTVTVRLMETSPANAKLFAMYAAQSLSSSSWGANVITVVNKANNETTVCRDVAFLKQPDITYTEEGQMREWVFNAGKIDTVSGTY